MIRKHSLFFGIACIIISLISCKSEDLNFGTNVLQDEDFVGAFADSTSVTVKMKTVDDDTIRTSKITYMLGSNYLPDAGYTKADFMTRFYFTDLSLDSTVLSKCDLDSICLIMYERNQYAGDTAVVQTIKVYELTDSIESVDCKNYYESLQKPNDLISSAKFIGDKNYSPRLDTVSYFRYNLPEAYSEDLYSRILSVYTENEDVQTVDSSLIKTFMGLYVTCDFSKSAIVNMAPQIAIYVHDADSTYKLILGPSATPYNSSSTADKSQIYLQALNLFTHDYSQNITDVLNTESDIAYLQGLAGLKTEIRLEGLDAWQDSNVVFNAVKLHVPIIIPTQKLYTAYMAPKFQVYTPSGNMIISVDGYQNDDDTTEYIFNLNAFMTYLNNNTIPAKDFKMQIVFPDNNVYGYFLILDGTLSEKLKLKITYTK